MIVRQVRIVEKKDYLNHFGSFQSIINEELVELTKDSCVSEVKIEYATDVSCVISYSLLVDEEDI